MARLGLGLGIGRRLPVSGAAPVAAPLLVSITIPAAGTTIEWKHSKAMDGNLTGKHTQYAVSGNTVTGLALKSGDATTIIGTLGTTVLYGDMVTTSYTKGTVVAADGGVLESFTNQAVTNYAYNPAEDEDLALNLKEMQEWSDGYYLNDYGNYSSNAKLVKSLALSVGSTSVLVLGSANAMGNAWAIENTGTTRWLMGFSCTNRTVNSDGQTNGVLYGGAPYTSIKGACVVMMEGTIRLRISDGSTLQTIDIGTISDDGIHRVDILFTMDSTRTVTTSLDGGDETVTNIVPTGTLYQSYIKLGGSTSSMTGALAYIKCLKNGSVTSHIPFSTRQLLFTSASRPQFYDTVSELLYTMPVNGDQWIFTNDRYPANCINGYDLYESATGAVDYHEIYVPHNAAGNSIAVNQSGNIIANGSYMYFKKQSFAGGSYNMCETQIQPNSTNIDELTTGGYPATMFLTKNDFIPPNDKTVISVDEGLALKDALMYFTSKTDAELQVICRYAGLTPKMVILVCGDSNAQGVALKTSMPEIYRGEQTQCKIWLTNTRELATFSYLNGSQPPVAGDDNYIGWQPPFVIGLAEDLYIVMYARSGSSMGLNWKNTGGNYYPIFIDHVRTSYLSILADGSYPVFQIICSFGGNDALGGIPAYIAGFKEGLVNTIAAMRAVVKQTCPVHIQKNLRMINADWQSIADDVDECAAGDIANFHAYSGASYDTLDNVHPDPTNCAGWIQMANNLLAGF